MSYNFLPYRPSQQYLLPPSLSEWVADDSLARFVSMTVDHLDQRGELAELYAPYRADGWGRAAYHPVMLLKVVAYAYCIGVTSSRKIARALHDDVALRYLSANQQPDFRTINEFRQRHLGLLSSLFVKVLDLCREAGLAKMGRVALDGRKVAGNASLDQNRTRKALEAEVKRMLEEAERIDRAEDEEFGPDRRGDELPEWTKNKEERLRRIQQAAERLAAKEQQTREEQERKLAEREEEERATGKKKRGRKPKQPDEVVDTDAKANMTDPDSRILKTRRGWVQGYNGQAVADCASQVIVACDITQDENDVLQLGAMLEQCERQAGQCPDEMSADAGYWSVANSRLGGDATELYIATNKDWKQRKALREKGPPRGRIPRSATARDLMERKLLTKRGRDVYRQRGSTIEPVFGQMVTRGLVRFLLRGVEKVRAEWALWCATHNLLKLYRHGWCPS